MGTPIDFHTNKYIIADRVWEEVVEIYGPNPHINHTRYCNLTRQRRDERSGVLERIYDIVPNEDLVSFVPIALWPDLDSVKGDWDTTLLKILLRCLNYSAAESRRKSSSSTLPTNVEVPPFGQLSPTAAPLRNPQVRETAVESISKAQDEMSESCRSNIVPGVFSNKSRQSTSSKASGAKDSSPRPKDPPAKPASSSSPPPPPPPVLDAAEELKHKIAIARAKRDYRRIIMDESTEQERTSLAGQKCLLEKVEFDLQAQKAEQVLEEVHEGAPFEKDVTTDPRTSRKRRIGALEVERAERRYEVAKAAKLEGKV